MALIFFHFIQRSNSLGCQWNNIGSFHFHPFLCNDPFRFFQNQFPVIWSLATRLNAQTLRHYSQSVIGRRGTVIFIESHKKMAEFFKASDGGRMICFYLFDCLGNAACCIIFKYAYCSRISCILSTKLPHSFGSFNVIKSFELGLYLDIIHGFKSIIGTLPTKGRCIFQDASWFCEHIWNS